MNFSADRVSGAMNEVIAKTGFIDEGANGTINFPAGDGAPGGNSLLHSFHADLLKCGGCYRVDCVASREMGLDLFFAPRGFELRDQIAGANHVLAQPADQLESSAIYERDVEN